MSLLPAASAWGQAAGSYQLAPTAGTCMPLLGGTAVPTVLCNDAVSGSLPIGFTFSVGGVSYTSFLVSSNGLLGFGDGLSDVGSALGNTFTSPNLAGASLPALAPFWTDLSGSPGTGATAQYLLSGAAPNRVLTMEWLNYKGLNADAEQYVSFQVKLYETTNRIESWACAEHRQCTDKVVTRCRLGNLPPTRATPAFITAKTLDQYGRSGQRRLLYRLLPGII